MFHTFTTDSARFDTDNLVSVAGLVLVLVLTLADRYHGRARQTQPNAAEDHS
ncbi:hypothetical protein AB0L63_26010 [Nocardia sp. NPDC051990]|uniref:hypothetical protein n=1 Tax=Nocardia sp. NPDC051990 TaxID=3155285 RepID=UPI0034251285